jgi:hypothetical protein
MQALASGAIKAGTPTQSPPLRGSLSTVAATMAILTFTAPQPIQTVRVYASAVRAEVAMFGVRSSSAASTGFRDALARLRFHVLSALRDSYEYPTPSGGTQFEWPVSGGEVSAEVGPNGSIYLHSIRFADFALEEREFPANFDALEVLAWLQQKVGISQA